MSKVVVMIDGWFMRKRIYQLKSFYYDGPNIRNYCRLFLDDRDVLYRIFYYDTEPLMEKGHNPINGWILRPDKFKALLTKHISVDSLAENDVRPQIEQKAVDMKIGLDITLIAMKKLSDLLIIITGDADIVPALKLARREGMQVGLDPLGCPIKQELQEHVDFVTTKVNECRPSQPLSP